MILTRPRSSELSSHPGPRRSVLTGHKLYSGMKTIYIERATEDMDVDLSAHKFDLVINEGGLVELARRLGCEV